MKYDPNEIKVTWNDIEVEGWSEEVTIRQPHFTLKDYPKYTSDHPDYRENADNLAILSFFNQEDCLTYVYTLFKDSESYKYLLTLDPYDINNKPIIKSSNTPLAQ
jgi:hypothetical protein